MTCVSVPRYPAPVEPTDEEQVRAARARARRALRDAGVLVATLTLLALTFRYAGVREEWTALRALEAGWLLVALLASIPQIVASALRWRDVARRLDAPLSFGRAVREYYRSFFVNQLLPLGVMGDLWRAGRQAEEEASGERVGFERAAKSVIFERVSGQIVLAFWTFASFSLWFTVSRTKSEPPFLAFGRGFPVLLVVLAVIALVGVVVAAARWRVMRRHWADARRALLSRGAWRIQGVLSTVVLLTLLVQFYCAARALGISLGPRETLLIALPSLGAAALPFVTAGWGAREAASATLFVMVGQSANQGALVSVVFGLIQLSSAVPGLLLVALEARKGKRVEKAEPLHVEARGAHFSIVHAALVLFCAGASWWGEVGSLVAVVGATSLLVYFLREATFLGWRVRLQAANCVTLARLLLVALLGTLRLSGEHAAVLVLAILSLDGLDGWIARRLGVETAFGARFDMETDALLVFVAGFVIHQAGNLGPWVLVWGAMRYLYVLVMATGAFVEAPPSRFGRAVFVAVALALVLSLWPIEPVHGPFALVATALLTYSFARSVRWSVS